MREKKEKKNTCYISKQLLLSPPSLEREDGLKERRKKKKNSPTAKCNSHTHACTVFFPVFFSLEFFIFFINKCVLLII